MAEDAEREASLQSIVKRVLPPEGTLQRFSSDVEYHDLIDALQSPSLFGGEAVVVLDECEKLKKKEVEKLSLFLEKSSQGLCGFLLLGARGKTSLIKVIEKAGIVLDMSEEKPWDKEKRLIESLADLAKNAGKRLSPDAASLLFERIGADFSLLTQELNKLICFVGDRLTIERSDLFQISSFTQTSTPWQSAEEIVWEGHGIFEESAFHSLLFAIRSQLQIGLKMTALLEEGVPSSEWASYFPKVWPRTLEKRKVQASKKGSTFFKKGLETLFKIECLSRTGSTQLEALFDYFRMVLKVHDHG